MADTFSINAGRQRPLILLGICSLVTAVFLALHSKETLPLGDKLVDSESYVQDWFVTNGRKTPVDPRLVLIGIDRASYAASDFSDEALTQMPVLRDLQKNFPWSRSVWAALIERLANAGAKSIVIDLVFANPGEGDDGLRQALEKFKDRVVTGCNYSSEVTERGPQANLAVPYPGILPPAGSMPVALDDRVGLVNVWADGDGVLRRANFRLQNKQLDDVVSAGPEAVIESLAARALRKLGENERIPDGFLPRRFRYTASPGQGYELHPIGDVLSPKSWKLNYRDGEFFRDKLVLIGPTANIFHDVHRTPFSRLMAGPELHLNIINAALHGEFLRELSPWSGRGLIVLAGLVAAALCRFVRQPVKRLLLIVVLSGGYLFGAFWLFNHANLVVLVVSPVLVLLTSGLAALGYDFAVERLERMKLRHTMGLYFSPRVLEAVLADPGSMKPRRADVTLLLTDLRNSTPLAETLGPKGMFELLNRVFEVQTNAIMSEEGNLEHFLGDQFLSYWGAPQPQPDAADRAERAAIKLITAMEQLRGSLPPEVQKLFGYGVALHSGSVLVGNKGSAKRLDYGLVGDTVNEAARIEALTKYYGAQLLISHETLAQLSRQGAHRLVDRVIVKGKSTPVELFECENPCTPKNYSGLCRSYEAAFDEYSQGHFGEAQGQFEKLAMKFDDGPSRKLAARCAQLVGALIPNWKGIWKMEAK